MKAKVTVHEQFRRGKVDDRFFGSFVEYLGRSIYGGIYDPGHPTANAEGFRRDVMDITRELRIPIIRYPGGNFVSTYNWEDGIGPVEDRPARLDLAWKAVETNRVGLHEFARWAEEVSAEILMTVNLGTRGVREALNLLEYCNHPRGSYWSDLRRKNGREEPFNVRHWCLSNELDGVWQVGQKTAAEYGRLANETAKAMKLLDGSIKVCACGSSFRRMPTFLEWDQTVLDLCYDTIDFLSLHSYLRNAEKDPETYLAESMEMDEMIDLAVKMCDCVKGRKKSTRTIDISFDEWNVWPRAREDDRFIDPWRIAPPLLEETYTMEDAVAFGCMLNVLFRHADRVKIACLSMLVNVFGPLMTENGGALWKQTIFYPFSYASRHGRGDSLEVRLDSPSYANRVYGHVPFVDVSAVYSEERGEVSLFAVNRSRGESVELETTLGGFQKANMVEQVVLDSKEPGACNTKSSPDAVVPRAMKGARMEKETARVQLPPLSWNMLRFTVSS
jgi:alpha-N-arabinofuranosidase